MIGQLVVVALGIWMMAAPAVVPMSRFGADILRVVGPLVATFAACAAAEHLRALRWWNLPLAIALLLGVVFGAFDGAAATIAVVTTAIAVALLSMRRGRIEHRYGGGWRALLHSTRAQE
jgi:uncharacterized membrane protein YfcA